MSTESNDGGCLVLIGGVLLLLMGFHHGSFPAMIIGVLLILDA